MSARVPAYLPACPLTHIKVHVVSVGRGVEQLVVPGHRVGSRGPPARPRRQTSAGVRHAVVCLMTGVKAGL